MINEICAASNALYQLIMVPEREKGFTDHQRR